MYETVNRTTEDRVGRFPRRARRAGPGRRAGRRRPPRGPVGARPAARRPAGHAGGRRRHDGRGGGRPGRDRAVDVAIVDYHLGGRNGLWVTRKLARAGSPPRVVIFSAFANDHLAANCVVAGADALLSKSSLGEELCSAIRSVAQRAQAAAAGPARDGRQRCANGSTTDEEVTFGMLLAGIPRRRSGVCWDMQRATSCRLRGERRRCCARGSRALPLWRALRTRAGLARPISARRTGDRDADAGRCLRERVAAGATIVGVMAPALPRKPRTASRTPARLPAAVRADRARQRRACCSRPARDLRRLSPGRISERGDRRGPGGDAVPGHARQPRSWCAAWSCPLQQLTALARGVDPDAAGHAVPRRRTEHRRPASWRSPSTRCSSAWSASGRESARRVLAAHEAERLRVAQELHDEVGQTLTAVLLQLSRVHGRVRGDLGPAWSKPRRRSGRASRTSGESPPSCVPRRSPTWGSRARWRRSATRSARGPGSPSPGASSPTLPPCRT